MIIALGPENEKENWPKLKCMASAMAKLIKIVRYILQGKQKQSVCWHYDHAAGG